MYARFSTQATRTFLVRTILSHINWRRVVSLRIAKPGAAPTGFVGAALDLLSAPPKSCLARVIHLPTRAFLYKRHGRNFTNRKTRIQIFVPTGNFLASRAITLMTATKCKEPLPHSF
jgi:hypothetical protein